MTSMRVLPSGGASVDDVDDVVDVVVVRVDDCSFFVFVLFKW